ncbi:MAG: hypothetical protein ACRDVL_03630 [Acidimicrobiia bacterium]
MGLVDVRAALTARLQDIPGVAQVVVDLDESSGGIHVRLEPGADEDAVLEKMRSLLVAYGLRPRESQRPGEDEADAAPEPHEDPGEEPDERLGVDVTITPIVGGARVEVSTEKVRSFRVVKPTPSGVAQGLAAAWCQVVGRAPFEITRVAIEDGDLVVTVRDRDEESIGRAPISDGWAKALTYAVGRAGALIGAVPAPLAVNS